MPNTCSDNNPCTSGESCQSNGTCGGGSNVPKNTSCGTGVYCDGIGNCKCKTKSDSNLLTNPGFDGSTSGWSTTGYSTTDFESCTGSGSAYVNPAGGAPNIDQCVTTGITGLANYGFGLEFKAVAGGGDGYCVITFYDRPGCAGNSSNPDNYMVTPFSDGTSWTASVLGFMTNSDTQSIDVFCSAANGNGYYDRLYLSSAGTAFF
jgi:hypothetical protein